MVGAFVVVVGAVGGFWEAGDEAADIGIGIEVVLFSMQHEDRVLDSRRAVIHAINESGERAEQAERVFLDVVGVGFGLFFVESGLGDLDVLLACYRIQRDASKRSGGGGDLNQGDFPWFDIVFEAHDGR